METSGGILPPVIFHPEMKVGEVKNAHLLLAAFLGCASADDERSIATLR
jgi:hypothetical protein